MEYGSNFFDELSQEPASDDRNPNTPQGGASPTQSLRVPILTPLYGRPFH